MTHYGLNRSAAISSRQAVRVPPVKVKACRYRQSKGHDDGNWDDRQTSGQKHVCEKRHLGLHICIVIAVAFVCIASEVAFIFWQNKDLVLIKVGDQSSI